MAVDGTYRITVDSPLGMLEFSGGSVNGDNFNYAVTAKTQMGDIKFDVHGVVDGDRISGTMKHQTGDTPFTGNRI